MLSVSMVAILFIGAGWSVVPSELEWPAMTELILSEAGSPGPDRKEHRSLRVVSRYEEMLLLPNDESAYDVWWRPKEGLPVRVISNRKSNDVPGGKIRLSDTLGMVRLRGDRLPRVDRVVIANVSDPGPGEVGHQPVQEANDYRKDMVVPEGEYSLWIVPSSGAKAQRIENKIRVLAGKITNVD